MLGVRVLDFSSFIAGSFGAMILGDLGADVIKIEPLGGDLARAWGPFLAGESRFFQSWNRSKRSIALDLAAPAGREVVHDLVRRADVAIENYRPGVTAKLGIDYETLQAVNPRIIYCSSTAFGDRGPDRDRPGYDPVLQTIGGAAAANARFNGGKVAVSAVAVSDYAASLLIAAGVSAALYHRERTGLGQKIETSLLQAIMTVQAHYFIKALECEEVGGLGIYPYRFFPTRDDQIFLAIGTDKFWRMMCEAIGAIELAVDPRYATNSQRAIAAAELGPQLESFFRRKTTAEWESILLAKGVPCGAARSCDQFFSDPQVEAMGMNPVIAHSTIGPIRTMGLPLHFGESPGAIQSAAPRLGEHTEEILAELGYDETRRRELRQQGVVGGG